MRALITGVTGQDGSYLAELLLSKGYEVHGVVRRASGDNRQRIDKLPLVLHEGDITDTQFVSQVVQQVGASEVYHLAAQSHVGTSFACPHYTTQVIVGGTLNVLEAVRQHTPNARVYNASTSEMYGRVDELRQQDENTTLAPLSPYAAAKVAAYHLAIQYRQRGLHVSSGIAFNHESPRRGANFVTRKITLGVAAIKAGKQDVLELGNLSAKRDWGYAPEYVEAMWLMVQRPIGGDYVLARGVSYTVEDFVKLAFGAAGLDWTRHVKTVEHEHRPIDVPVLCGNPMKAWKQLGWEAKVDLPTLVDIMVKHDLKEAGVE